MASLMLPYGRNNSSDFTRSSRFLRGGWERLLLFLFAAGCMGIQSLAQAQSPSDLYGYQANYPVRTASSQTAEFFLPWRHTAEQAIPVSGREPDELYIRDAQPLRNPAAEYAGITSPSFGETPFDLNADRAESDHPFADEAEARLVQYELVSPTKLPPNAIIDVADYEKISPDRIEYQVYDPIPTEYEHQLMPQGLIYRAYLAGEKESRFRSVWNHDRYRGWIWDITLGGRVGLYRYGSTGDQRPVGFQVDIEGAGLVRLDLEENRDVDAADFRFGIPLTWGNDIHQVKFAYYHLSSHLGDEFLLKHSGYPRLNYSRDALVLGHSYYMTDELRLYGEVGYAMYSDVALQWEFQFGIEYAPVVATGLRGAPFAAVNAHLMEELDYGGNFVAQAGWAWRSTPASGLFRLGVQYFTGGSDQFSFYRDYESKFGFGIWYDY